MLLKEEALTQEELNKIANFFEECEANLVTAPEEETNVSRYITSLATGCYAKSVEEIANTKVGNRIVRKRNLQQVMRESFFYGANRFGNNFIA